jgi:hypothetical protein
MHGIYGRGLEINSHSQPGVGGGAPALRPLARCSARNTRRRPLSPSFHLSSFAMRWTVPVPMPSDLATSKKSSSRLPQKTNNPQMGVVVASVHDSGLQSAP